MRHVPMADFKDKMAETIAAAEAGEEIVITRHGRDTVKLGAVMDDDVEARRQSFACLAQVREQMRARGVPTTTRAEVREWIAEGRR